MFRSIADTDRPVNQRFGRTQLQVLIDTNTDSPAEMRALARILIEAADAATTPEPQIGVEGWKLAGVTPVLEIKTDAPPPPPPPPRPPEFTLPPGVPDISGRPSDSAGVVWDPKLHTSTKTKDIDGKWKARKPREAPVPLHPATVPSGTTPTPPPPPAPPATMATPTPPPPPTVMVPSTDDDIDVTTDDTGEPEMVQTGASAGIDFATFIVQITTALNAGEITQARISEVQKQFNLTSLFSLNDLEAAKLQDVAKAFGFVS